MFKKPKRNFRGRRRDSESDDEIHSESPSKDSPSFCVQPSKAAGASIAKAGQALNNQSKNKENASEIKKVPSLNAVLSFVNDEDADGEVFQIKKPSHSKRLVKQIKKECLKDKDTDGARPVKFEVTYDNDVSNGSNSMNIKKEEPLSDEDHSDNASDDNEEGSEEGKAGLTMQDILKSGQIPDASLIHLARKRRQLARERGDEFIPLDSDTTASGKKKSSRLIRDDDDDRSDDSDDEQYALTSRQKDMQRRRMEETILAAAEESHSEASDQELEWEEQQIRKGVSIPAQPVAPTTYSDYYADYHQPFSYVPASTSGNFVASVLGVTTTAISHTVIEPPTDLPALTVDSVKKRLTDRLSEMCNVHRVHVHERDDMCSRVEMSTESIAHLTSQTTTLEEQYKFFQEMRGYVRDLVECLNEKMTSVNYLDRCILKLYKERSERLIKRHQEDVKDQSLEYMPGKTAVNIAGDFEDKKRRRADREGRRTRRKRMREVSGVREHNDGLSTDDELPTSETTKFSVARDELVKSVATTFNDVIDDFSEMDSVRSRFETWKKNYAESYNEAFIGLCLPKLFTPFVKLELVCWNPLEANCVDFEDSRWFNSLMLCGHCDGQEPVGDDLKLIPNIVDKVLLPRLTVLVESVWDPLSMQQTVRLTKLIHRLVDDYPTVHANNKNTQVLIKAVIQRIRKTLDDDVFMPLYPKQILENRSSDAAVFFHRQFWTCIKLLRSIMEWNGIISHPQLLQLACDSLLNRYLLVALQNSVFNTETFAKCQAIVDALPRDWFIVCQSDLTLPQLDNFCRCLVNLAANLCPANPQTVMSKDTKDLIRNVIRLLLKVCARNYAVSLANRANLTLTN